MLARARGVARLARGETLSNALLCTRRAVSGTQATTSAVIDRFAGEVREERTATTLLRANSKRFDPASAVDGGGGDVLEALLLRRSEDLRCVDVMCQYVGESCACRLARALDRRGASLRVLDVSGNALRALPSVLWTIPTLEALDASNNALALSDVPFDDLIAKGENVAPRLKYLNVSGNVALLDALNGRVNGVVRDMARRGVELVL
jgi:Leucine-rich repeat (LRR) protein